MARNAGWEAAASSSKWIAFLDADDEWLPEKLRIQTDWMLAHSEYAWSAHGCQWGGRGNCRPSTEFAARRLAPGRLLWRNPVCTSSVLVRRDVPIRFREGWRHCEDMMLWFDWHYCGYAGAVSGLPLVARGRADPTGGGETGRLREMHAGEIKVLDTCRTEGRIGAVAVAGWGLWLKIKYQRRRLRTLWREAWQS
jgi:glycosyltransferase involved in cell wall biosynthesis